MCSLSLFLIDNRAGSTWEVVLYAIAGKLLKGSFSKFRDPKNLQFSNTHVLQYATARHPSVMGIFTKTEDNAAEEFIFPCLALNNAPTVVPLPGVLYKITFTKENAVSLLREFKNCAQFQDNSLLNGIMGSSETSSITESVYKSTRMFKSKHDPEDDNPASIYICLIPFESADHSAGSISKITGILIESKFVTISFKALRRAKVKKPILNTKDELFTSEVEIADDSKQIRKWSKEQLHEAVVNFIRLFDEVDQKITAFKNQYSRSTKRIASESSHLLLLSPLSNTLFFQFNKTQFRESWKILKSFLGGFRNVSINPDVCTEVVAMMDLVVAILPLPLSQKSMFLSLQDLVTRGRKFKQSLDEFREIFDKLYESTEYVEKYFSQASDLEKSRLIANQLKSLRFYIDDIKRSNSSRNVVRSRHEAGAGQLTNIKKPSNFAEEEDETEEGESELEVLKKFVDGLQSNGVHPDGVKMMKKDFKRFIKMTPQNSEYQVLRNYFDIVMDIPFGHIFNKNVQGIDLSLAQKELNEGHYGLFNVKKRLMEYLCVLKLNEKIQEDKKVTQLESFVKEDARAKTGNHHGLGEEKPTSVSPRGSSPKSPILLLVGPPGVGKTSIAKSIADVLGRSFQRISLGGVHNEAEIRGHRRTYVGSMSGLLINALRKSGCMNPLILLDEVDKVLNSSGAGGGHGNKLNGDPGAALLEVLDPEQNHTFMDHYVGFPVDLSQVLFFCTANDLSGITEPLLDRMEVVEIPGYMPEEKIKIGSQYLLPKQIGLNGLDKIGIHVTLSDEAWRTLVLEYTREPGVRNLERNLASIVRGKVVEYINGENNKEQANCVNSEQLFKYLGLPLHPISRELTEPIKFSEKYGIVNGLSYNSDGTGSVLVFEVIKTGNNAGANGPTITTTGNLGTVLNESIDIACSFVKSILTRGIIRGIDEALLKEFASSDYHLHVPMGAISKDGPSAGVAISLALLSLAIKRPVDPRICMTGEITLRGKVLPIGGVKEKLLGAQMYGMKKVLLPKANRRDLLKTLAETDENQDTARYYDVLDDPNHPEISLVQDKTGLQVCYANDFYDVVEHIWPDQALVNVDYVATHHRRNTRSTASL